MTIDLETEIQGDGEQFKFKNITKAEDFIRRLIGEMTCIYDDFSSTLDGGKINENFDSSSANTTISSLDRYVRLRKKCRKQRNLFMFAIGNSARYKTPVVTTEVVNNS